jgi:hypothetical protein
MRSVAHRRAAHIAAQPFELGALVRGDVHRGVQRKPAGTRRTIGIILLPRRLGWQQLQREQLLPGARAGSVPSR